jgi:hypothetical protein
MNIQKQNKDAFQDCVCSRLQVKSLEVEKKTTFHITFRAKFAKCAVGQSLEE